MSFSVEQTGSPKAGLDYASALQIVSGAFARWPAATCEDGAPSIAVQATAPLVCERVEYNPTGPNGHGVIFRDDSWPHDPAIIGLTTVTFNVKTAEILDADMEINTAEQPFTPDIMSFVVTHEAGHFFGVDHTRDPSAIMYPQFSGFVAAGGVALTPDDVAAICAAYPASRPRSTTCDFEPPKGFAPDCGGDVVASCAIHVGEPPSTPDEVLLAALMTGIVAAATSRRRRPTPPGGRGEKGART